MSEFNYTKIEFEKEGLKRWWRPEINKNELKKLHEKKICQQY